jgi:Trk K+ transport system NAD-binding subunit
LIRGDRLYEMDNSEQFAEGDIVVVFAPNEKKEEMESWIYAL